MLRRYVLAALPLLLVAASAPPPPPPPWAEARGDLDGDGKPERAHLEHDGTLVIDGSDGRELGRVALPDGNQIERATVRIRAVEARAVVHARAETGKGRAVEAVWAGGRPIFVGPTGPVGDGERAERLRVDEAGVVRWQTTPGFSRCDGDEMLFPERWDFVGGRFRPVTDEPPAAGKRLHASAAAPSGLGGAPLGLFHFVAASIDASGDRRADRLAAPRELEDGATSTTWSAGSGASARGAWATARAQTGAPKVRALEIVGAKEAPRAVTVVLGPAADQQFTVEVGPGRQWVILPEPQSTACVSVIVAETNPRANALAEVAIYTDVDGPGGLERLISDVVELKPNADGAAHVLESRGVEAARAVATVLPTTHGQGRRRLLQVLEAIGSTESAPALGKALETAEPEDRATLIAALAKLGPAGAREAIRVYGDASQTGEARADAALVLGQLPSSSEGVAALVAGAGRGEPLVRVTTMRALVRIYDDAAIGPEAIESALGAGGDEARVGDLARTIGFAGRRAATRPSAAASLTTAWQRTRPAQWELRLRLARAMGDVGAAALLPSLTEAARDKEPIVRAAAMSSAGHVRGGQAIARAGASDADPGVRRAALEAIAGSPEGADLDEAALAHDPWPLVRRAAADALGALCVTAHLPARPSLVRAVSGEGKSMRGVDPSEEVRRAALLALGRCREVPLSTFVAVLAEKRQPASVRELAAALVARHGGADAAQALAAALDDVLGDPAADERSVALAVSCTRALARTGDGSHPVLVALGEAANEPLSAAVRAAAMDTIGQLCPSGAGEALHKGAKDPDGTVVRAARSALERCHR